MSLRWKMINETKSSLSVTEANQNFSKAEKKATANGSVILLKRNRPKYLLIDLEKEPQIEMTDDEKIDFVARRILNKHRHAFEVLAQ